MPAGCPPQPREHQSAPSLSLCTSTPAACCACLHTPSTLHFVCCTSQIITVKLNRMHRHEIGSVVESGLWRPDVVQQCTGGAPQLRRRRKGASLSGRRPAGASPLQAALLESSSVPELNPPCVRLRAGGSPLPVGVVLAAEPAAKAVQQLLGRVGQLLNGVENLDQVGVGVLHAARLHSAM